LSEFSQIKINTVRNDDSKTIISLFIENVRAWP